MHSYHIGVERDPIRRSCLNQYCYPLKSYIVNVWMHALDNFIFPIPGFEEDIPIPAIPVSARSPSDRLASDPSARASAGASKTHAGKQKATANPTPQKKAKKTPHANPLVGSKSMNPHPKLLPLRRLLQDLRISEKDSDRSSRCTQL
jgi:hypothetical protein